MIPVADPKASYLAHKQDLDRTISEVMENGWYIFGPRVHAFESHFASYLGARFCVGVGNGTDAIQLGLRSIGVESGDAVITASHTAVATVSAIDWIGATPVLVDIDPATFTLDPQKVEETIMGLSGRVKAIVPVHLYGHPADMGTIINLARQHGIMVLEDCAQAHGAKIGIQKVGTIGLCGSFSFYPTKNLGAFGDGGAIVTDDSKIEERLRLLQQYGWRDRYISDAAGYNSRLDEIQAAILDYKLAWLEEGNQRRRAIAKRYNDGLKDLPLDLPMERPGFQHVYHQYVIRCPARDELRKHLATQGISTTILYPMPVHQQPGYSDKVIVGEGGLNVTELLAKEILCLPMFPELSDTDVDRVIQGARSFWK